MSPTFHFFAELPSTHDYAISLLSKTTPPNATVIVADYQTAGKGRFNRSWLSHPGSNALLSLILYPTFFKASQAFLLNVISTMATVKLLVNMGIPSPRIKWPNDVLVNGKKIAGTLIRNQLSKGAISSSVVSIGLNVNQQKWEDGYSATSIKLINSTEINVEKIIRDFVHQFLADYNAFKSHQNEQKLLDEWKTYLIGYGLPSLFSNKDNERFTATLRNVRQDGKIILKVGKKSVAFHMDEMRFIKTL